MASMIYGSQNSAHLWELEDGEKLAVDCSRSGINIGWNAIASEGATIAGAYSLRERPIPENLIQRFSVTSGNSRDNEEGQLRWLTFSCSGGTGIIEMVAAKPVTSVRSSLDNLSDAVTNIVVKQGSSNVVDFDMVFQYPVYNALAYTHSDTLNGVDFVIDGGNIAIFTADKKAILGNKGLVSVVARSLIGEMATLTINVSVVP